MDVWQDDFDRKENSPFRKAIQLSLGKLNEGEYEFRTVHRHMLMDAKTQPWYQFKSELAGSVEFRVTNPEDEIKTKAVLLEEQALREPKEKPKEMGSFRQIPVGEAAVFTPGKPGIPTDLRQWVQRPPDIRDSPPLAPGKGELQPGMAVGTFDWQKWTARGPIALDNLPQFGPLAASTPAYVSILSPPLNSGETMTLREIRWKDKEAILYVDVWRDSLPRAENAISVHHLLVPLQTPGKSVDGKWQTAPGDYRFKVEWTVLLAPNAAGPGELYTPQDPTKPGEKDAYKELLKRTEANVTIK
jgi:hypothetical protein